MADWSSLLADVAMTEVDRRGLQIRLKTDFGPEVVVYDRDQPADPGGLQWIQAGIRVTDREGRIFARYGDYPQTNYLKLGGAVLVAYLVGLVLLRGVIK